MTTGKLLGLMLLASASLTSTAIAQTVQDGGRKFTTPMTGLEEVSAAFPNGGAGDTDGSGTGTVTINPGQRRVCWEFTVANIAAPNRGHIHKAPAGVNGPIVVNFFNVPPFDTTPDPAPALSGCTADLNRELLNDIIQHPTEYYLNLHNADFQAGAIRGQLEKKQP